ncbi:MAG: CoA transferase [Chloroflexota bacterium]|nr:CoA transferase [Chloroflexota bacterium]
MATLSALIGIVCSTPENGLNGEGVEYFSMSEKALHGLNVIEWAEFVSGPYCGKLLADLGANVIKIEKPGCGDSARAYGPFPRDLPHHESSGLFLYLNTNKLGVTLDTASASGAKVFRRLLEQADILIENHPPGEVAELGFDYESLAAVNPRLIVTSITPFGQTGPFRDYRSCNLVSFHTSGMAFINPSEGVEDTERDAPLKAPEHQGDLMAGLSAAVATMCAVMGREVTGQGQHVDVSEQEALASIMRRELGVYTIEGVTWTRQKGSLLGQTSDVYQCGVGAVHLSCSGDRHWPCWVEVMGNPEWATSEIFLDQALRRENWDAAKVMIEEWLAEHTADEVVSLAEAVRVPCRQVNTARELVESDLLDSRDYFAELDHEVAGQVILPGAPYKLSETPWSVSRPAPRLGQHNVEVYCDRLGYSRDDLVHMRAEGVV